MANKAQAITCRIWATEVSPEGYYHRCHSDANGLAGHTYPKNDIENVLRTKPTWGGIWKLIACEPNHDGEECKNCVNRSCKGLSYCFDLNRQKEALRRR
jgi:hypothetical protein